MTAPRLDHTSITTADLERSIAFYRDVVGLPLLGRGDAAEPELSALVGLDDVKIRWAELDLGGGPILELVEYVSPTGEALDLRPNRPGATHLGLAVDDVVAMQRRLADAGALISEDVVVLTEEGDWNGVRSVYARDPDGVSVEFVERPDRIVEIPEVAEDRGSTTEP